MHLKSIDQATYERLIDGMTRIHRFAGTPETLTGHHEHLGFVALIRQGDIAVAVLDGARAIACDASPPCIESPPMRPTNEGCS